MTEETELPKNLSRRVRQLFDSLPIHEYVSDFPDFNEECRRRLREYILGNRTWPQVEAWFYCYKETWPPARKKAKVNS